MAAGGKPSSKRRLSKADRREQMIETALEIIRESGADALTLGYLAERAGISKPIAYEHFGTRSGLLIALYRRIDEQQVRALLDSLATARHELDEVARLIARAYMTCHSASGPEGHAISAALMGDPQMEAVQQDLRDGCVRIVADALAPFSKLARDALEQRCVGIVGAAEALSRDMTRGRLDKIEAIDNLTALIVNGIDPC